MSASGMETSVVPPPMSVPSMGVEGRLFVVTGGTQGLGLEIARCLKKNGARGIALVSRSAGKGEEACSELNCDTCRVAYVCADMSDAHAPGKMIEEAVSLFRDLGPISGVVNAAAYTARGNLFTTTADEYDGMMAINARAPFLVTQAAAKHMMEAHVRGSIVNICSVASTGGAPFIMAYCASKAALVCQTKNNAAELAPSGIRVNGVNMGWCYTDNEDALQTRQNGGDSRWIDKADAGVPLKRIIRPADVAATVLFLLSDAAAMMSGGIIDLHPEYAAGMQGLAAVDSVDTR
jgi:NAD(P)-dependent dehydrogenase (short-subunit alcohol dehydrogenase family)